MKLWVGAWMLGCIGASAAFAAAAQPVSPPDGAAGRLIARFHMQRVPQEGVWFASTYASEDRIEGAALPLRYAGRSHGAGNAIIALATSRDFSALHRLQSDEVWHFYGGSPVDVLLLYPDGHASTVILGSHVFAGEAPQLLVPHGVWQGAIPRGTSRGRYSLFGTQLSPAFDYADFEVGSRDELTRHYPAYAKAIARLTR